MLLSDGIDALALLAPLPLRPKMHVKPMRTWRYDASLECDIRGVYGYRYVCTKHGDGPKRATWAAARRDLEEHKETCR